MRAKKKTKQVNIGIPLERFFSYSDLFFHFFIWLFRCRSAASLICLQCGKKIFWIFALKNLQGKKKDDATTAATGIKWKIWIKQMKSAQECEMNKNVEKKKKWQTKRFCLFFFTILLLFFAQWIMNEWKFLVPLRDSVSRQK